MIINFIKRISYNLKELNSIKMKLYNNFIRIFLEKYRYLITVIYVKS